jgi:hypothetical protein
MPQSSNSGPRFASLCGSFSDLVPQTWRQKVYSDFVEVESIFRSKKLFAVHKPFDAAGSKLAFPLPGVKVKIAGKPRYHGRFTKSREKSRQARASRDPAESRLTNSDISELLAMEPDSASQPLQRAFRLLNPCIRVDKPGSAGAGPKAQAD